ncbi:MAG: glycosyltransferase family 4 protein [Vicinamibacterales bacterium]
MRILLSAYSCEPGRGSEPGVGWNTAIELGRHHDVWVVTKSRHREPIERELAARPRPGVHFVYFDMPPGLHWTRRESHVQLHYYLWQYGVYGLARRLQRSVGFDVAFHATFGRRWSPSLFALLPIPFVWGSVGGGEVVPTNLRDLLPPRDRLVERLKGWLFGLSRFDPIVRLTARRSSSILANNDVTAATLAAMGGTRIQCMDATAVDRETMNLIDGLQEPPAPVPGDPVRFATLSRLLPWKGIQLGLRAFHQLGDPRARYVIAGEGPQREPLLRLANELGIADRVEFRENASRAEWMQIIKACHAVIHPALANRLNTIVLEAMLCARPIICFNDPHLVDRLGPDTSYFVDGRDSRSAVEGFAEALRCVAAQPAAARQRGLAARRRALRLFTWDTRREQLLRLLDEVVTGAGEQSARLLRLPHGGEPERHRWVG